MVQNSSLTREKQIAVERSNSAKVTGGPTRFLRDSIEY